MRRGLGWLVVLLAGASSWGVLFQWKIEWALYLIPGPAFLVALVALRPRDRIPEDAAIDWGTTFGHPWIATADRVSFVGDPNPPQWVARVRLDVRPDGFQLDVPAAGAGLPRLRWLLKVAWQASMVAPVIALVALQVGSPTSFDGFIGILGAFAGLVALLLAPWALVGMGVRWLARQNPRTTRVRVVGRRVEVGGDTHYLSRDTRLVQDAGLLTLETGDARLVIRGRADHVRALVEAIGPIVEGLSDAETDVPETLRTLVSDGARA